MTNLTPAQLEEFESTFRHFDTNQTNSLNSAEFNAALASLGIMYEDEVFAGVFAQCSQGGSEVTFEQVNIHCKFMSVTKSRERNKLTLPPLFHIFFSFFLVHYIHGGCH